MFEHIEILNLRASFISKEDGRLPPYLGSTIRGVLGHCIRDFACRAPEKKCYLCEFAKECLYAECFCSPGNVAGAVNPFVVNVFVRNKTEWQAGDRCIFELVLFGRITQKAGLFLDALQAMGRRGWGASRLAFELEYIVNPINNTMIYQNGRTWLRNLQPVPIPNRERLSNEVLLRFDTPLRILESRVLCEKLPFVTLVRAMLRRLALISQAYTGKMIEYENNILIEKANEIKTVDEKWERIVFKRYSINREDKLVLDAVEGWALYAGDLTPFTPLIDACEFLHIGKNATIGFGHYNAYYDR
mgnify:CR=1 FL=1